MPFNFEGPKRSKAAHDCLSKIQTISESETVFSFENQDLIKLDDGNMAFREAFVIANNKLKEKITNYFSIDSGEDILPETPKGYKTRQQISEETDVPSHILQFWETQIDKPHRFLNGFPIYR